MSKVAVVILNYNGRDFLEKFLPGVISKSQGHHIVVADNQSTDDSVEFVQSTFPNIQIIINSNNGGYSQGYNEALSKLSEFEYFVLLNSDVDVTDRWIEPVIELLEKDASIAAIQPKILDYNNKRQFEYAGAAGGFIDTLGYPFCRGRIFLHLEEDLNQYNDTKQIFWATGACLFVRSKVFFELNGLDPDFFAHMEEIDLCWRINSAGYKVYYTAQSRVYHVGGGTLDKSNPKKTYFNFRNGLALLYKNYTNRELWFKLPLRILLDLIAAIKFMLFDSIKDGIAVFKAHIHFWKELPLNYKKRQLTKKQKFQSVKHLIYRKSIVWEYFAMGKRKYEQLKFRL